MKILTSKKSSNLIITDNCHNLVVDESLYPKFNYNCRVWDKESFELEVDEFENDDFMPCAHLIFEKNGEHIGLLRGNISNNVLVLEYLEVAERRLGYGTAIINNLHQLGVEKIVGYTSDLTKPFWLSLGAEFSGRLVFDRYPLFELNL